LDCAPISGLVVSVFALALRVRRALGLHLRTGLRWTWGVSGFPEWRSVPFAITSLSSQPVVSY